MNKIKRPLVWMVICFMLGIVGGEVYLKKGHFLPLFLVGSIAILVVCIKLYSYKAAGIFFISLLLGIVITIEHPVIQEKKYFAENNLITIEGTAGKIAEGTFNDTITLHHVVIKDKSYNKVIKSKVNISISKQNNIKFYDTVLITGKPLSVSKKMNPSDMDYEKYLMSQNITASMSSVHYERIGTQPINKMSILSYVDRQIQHIFKGQDKGIIRTLLIGDDESVPDEVYEIYSKTGIGHVLSISGFHIALLISVLYFLLSHLGIPYTPKYITISSIIWIYAFLTGASTSTMRACIMATLIIAAKCIWEEEDLWINLALAAGIILLFNPFQLSQVGFELSFAAVGALLISNRIMAVRETYISKKHYKIMRIFMPWLCVTLGTYPILAFHFYEIPLICTLLNLILIPVFSFIIIIAWSSLLMSLISMNIAVLMGKIIIFLLNIITFVGDKMLHMPFGTICIGKPSLLSILVYYSLLGVIFLNVIGFVKKEVSTVIIMLTIGTMVLYEGLLPKTLDIAYLYIGQGDGIVMTTPHHKVIIVDGGNFGKGKVIEKYVKYKGKKTISAIILSHSDADHIGGVIDLMDTDIKIENVFISKSDESPLMKKLMDKCFAKKVNVYRAGYLDSLTVDKVMITCLMPKDTRKEEDNNNNSLGFMLQYKKFSALFTGDMDKSKELELCKSLSKITVLKISHHGSKTATSKETLLKIRPRYAIISCGIKNRYNHPHQDTLDTLRAYPIEVLRTDTRGAVLFKTDGEKVSVSTQIKGNE